MAIQEGIAELTRFWADKGCLVLAPTELEIPAGELHPDVFFRLLDGGTWNAAYLQGVRRPLDSRHGRHPYRLTRHLQFQVVLQGFEGNVRELYLDSLRALGFDLSAHDLRFTEWVWEARSIASWGLGWHVELDGLGVTRLTFMQKLGGRELRPTPIGISYGVERLFMSKARVRSTFELPWVKGGADYGDLRRQSEIEHSHYAVEVAGVDVIKRQIEDLHSEARSALAADLPRVAYELAVRSVYAIDLLDARGVLAGGEREERLHRVGALVTAAAEHYLGTGEPPTEADNEKAAVAEPSGDKEST
jgi:glycyl-tRNA synthetase alpha chain